ncbi:MAG: SixA phosphatase family protein, partial [Dolichospermum sp.]
AQRELPLTHENLESALYEATSDQIVESVRKLDDKVRNICVVGHNPALQDLAARLTKSKKARRDIESHFPPGSLIVLAFGKGGSGRFNFGTGKVALFRRPDADHR